MVAGGSESAVNGMRLLEVMPEPGNSPSANICGGERFRTILMEVCEEDSR
jgi:hypothetical protein